MVQPVPRPKTYAELDELYAAGVLITVGGDRLVRTPCSTCDQYDVGATCPASIECPDCHSTRKRCMRPSGHEAAEWHADRVQAAQKIDDEREAAGDLTVPARWA